MEFTIALDWRFDLRTNAMDPSFRPINIDVKAVVDDQHVSTGVVSQDTTRILFGGVRITSPLPQLVSMGYDVTSLGVRNSIASVQDTFVTQTNQGTWTNLYESHSSVGVVYSKNLQFTADPRLPNPSSFKSNDLWLLLSSHLNKQYGYREDVTFPGGGFQHHGQATLKKITRGASASVFPEAVVPHIASGGSWSTTVRIYNTTDISQSVRMEFFDANGLRQPIRANGIDRTTSSYDLNPKSTLDVVLDDLGSSTKIGFAKVAFLGSRELRITVFYADSGGVEGAVTSFSSAALETVPFDMTEGVSTSIAVVASQETGIPRIGLNCYDSAGKKLDSVGLTEVGQKYQAVDLMSKAPQLVGHKGFCSIVEQNGGSATWTAARHFVVSLRFKGRSFVPTTF